MTSNEYPKLPPLCPDCTSLEVFQIGRAPSTNAFAGRELPYVFDGGFLWRCRACHLAFRFPACNKAKLDALYEAGAEDAWNSSPEERRDWRIACQWLRQNLPDGATILDVGCFDGGFLDLMGDAYKRYGIEIHPKARRRAEAKGISVVGDDFEAVDGIAESVDCVTAFDVIEHVRSPRKLLVKCSNIVKPGGRIVISTGNFDALAFRFMGAGYWYAAIAEHLSFISLQWCNTVAAELDLIVEKQTTFSHGKRGLRHYSTELIKNVIYRVTPGLFHLLRQRGYGKINAKVHAELANHPPVWMTAKDHFITLFRKR